MNSAAGGKTPTTILDLDGTVRLGKEHTIQRPHLRAEDLALLNGVDGQRTVAQVLHLSGLAGSVAMRRLRSLHERGIVETAPAQATRPVEGPASDPRSGLSGRTRDLTNIIGEVKLLVRNHHRARPGQTAIGLPAITLRGLVPSMAKPDAIVPPMAPANVVTPPALAAAPSPAVGPAPAPVALSPSAKGEGAGLRTYKLGPYEVLLRIAQGGMGSVYLCRRGGPEAFPQLYTLKVVREHCAEAEQAHRALQREAEIGLLLRHPNVLTVRDFAHQGAQPYLVLDYVEGASLADLLATGAAPPGVVASVMMDVLKGLQAAHEQTDNKGAPLGLVHCDLSPQNIIVGVDGVGRLGDFGTARLAADAPLAVDRAALVGKPAYMAPEQICGEPVDRRTDLFSAGVVLWTALTGQKLFAEETYDQTAMNVLRKRIPPPSELGVPACFDAVCVRALTRAAEGRYQSAEEMLMALMQAAAPNGFLVSSAEVGRWVRRAVGETLDERRRRAQMVSSIHGGERPEPKAEQAPVGDVIRPVGRRRPTLEMSDDSENTQRVPNARTLSHGNRVLLAAAGVALSIGTVLALLLRG